MARQHSTSPIPAFPSDIDRRDFGNWLAGFVDGEGSFILYFYKGCPKATFTICLRADDKPILDSIRSFLGCGSPIHVARVYERKLQRGNENRTARYAVRDFHSLKHTIVPFFDAHRLRAKKSHDFLIWREAVDFVYRINRIKQTSLGCKGLAVRWTDARRAEFQQFISSLKSQRAFDPPMAEIAEMAECFPLFDISDAEETE